MFPLHLGVSKVRTQINLLRMQQIFKNFYNILAQFPAADEIIPTYSTLLVNPD
jgi:hypothetical protein